MNAGGQDTVFFTPLLQHDDFFFTNDDKGLVERWVRVVVLVQLQFLDVRGRKGKRGVSLIVLRSKFPGRCTKNKPN